MEGKKYSQNKPKVGMLFSQMSRALNAIALAATHGNEKYSNEEFWDENFTSVPNAFKQYSDGLGRHLLLESQEELDKDSKMPHEVHVAWNALARLEIKLRENEKSNSEVQWW